MAHDGAAIFRIYKPLPTCYRVSSSATKSVRINRKEPQNWGALGPCPIGMEA